MKRLTSILAIPSESSMSTLLLKSCKKYKINRIFSNRITHSLPLLAIMVAILYVQLNPTGIVYAQTSIIPTCPNGTTLSNGVCVSTPICPTGTAIDPTTSSCTGPPTSETCPAGTSFDGQFCTGSSQLLCPAGYTLVPLQCAPNLHCPGGTALICEDTSSPTCSASSNVPGQCYATPTPGCPSGTSFDANIGYCFANPISETCPDGTSFNANIGSCESTPTCPANTTAYSGNCVATPTCPTNTTLSDGSCLAGPGSSVKDPSFIENNKLSQGNSAWSGTPISDNGKTLGQIGCAITSATMLINYEAHEHNLNFITSPNDLAIWLQENNGLTGGGGIADWNQVALYAQKNGVNLYFNSNTDGQKNSDNDLVNTQMQNDVPQILHVQHYGNDGKLHDHFVLAYRQDGSTWDIADPGFSATKLSDPMYENVYAGVRSFSYGKTGTSTSIHVHARSPVTFLITDPEGRLTGKNPITDTNFNQIPDSTYYAESIVNAQGGDPAQSIPMINLQQPVDGSYNIQVMGTGNGNYHLDFIGYDNMGIQHFQEMSDSISFGMIKTYQLSYTSSGAFTINPVSSPTGTTASATASVTIAGTCGVQVTPATLSYGTVTPGSTPVNALTSLGLNNTGTVAATLTVTGGNWTSGTADEILASNSQVSTTAPAGPYAPLALHNVPVSLSSTFAPFPAPHTNSLTTYWQLIPQLLNLGYTGSLTQQMTFTATC